jgi:hypothetical protein
MLLTKAKSSWQARCSIGLMALAVLVPAAGAYVNGGDYYDTQRSYEKRLKAKGWAVHFGTALGAECAKSKEVADGVKVTPVNNAKYQKYVNQLIGKALKALPEKEVDKISTETKREVARLARRAIKTGVLKNQQFLKRGQVGSLEYQVGVLHYKKWWETNYPGEGRRIHARQEGLVPTVALKIGGNTVYVGTGFEPEGLSPRFP